MWRISTARSVPDPDQTKFPESLKREAVNQVLAGLGNIEGAGVGVVSEGGGFRQGLILETQGDWLLFYIPDGGPTGGTAGEVRALPAVEVIVTDIP
jgi:hypothetical protein